MSTVTSTHIVFEQQVVGQYTRRGAGDVRPQDGAARFELSTEGEDPELWVVIGGTGYWRDEAVPGGWTMGPVAPFSSNPATWVALIQHHTDASWVDDETIAGTDCYHVRFTLRFDPDFVVQGGGSGEAWIAKTDDAVVRAIYDLHYQSYRESGSMSLAMELSRLDQPVSISKPE